MIFSLVRWLVILFVLMTIVYVVLGRYYRWDRRKTLEAEYIAKQQVSDGDSIESGERAAYVARGMSDYDRSLRKKLILGVYFVPVAIVTALVLIANFN